MLRCDGRVGWFGGGHVLPGELLFLLVRGFVVRVFAVSHSLECAPPAP